jgi:hypothetical protein
LEENMLEHRFTTRLTAVMASALCFSCAHVVEGRASSPLPPPAGDPRLEMIAALQAPGPHPAMAGDAHLFDRFVGTWDADYVTFTAEGSPTRFTGQVFFGWIIDGHALQDIWVGYPPGKPRSERNIGTSVRFYDARRSKWRVTWIAPTAGTVIGLEGGPEGDRIVLYGPDTDGSPLRWSFNDIRADSFLWRGEGSRDGGKTWWLQEEHRLRRHQPGT